MRKVDWNSAERGAAALDGMAGMKKARSVIPESDLPLAAWPKPTPLPDKLTPVMKFDPDLLPKTIAAWVMDIAHRMQCPPDFPAIAAIVALSSLIGARAAIYPKRFDNWLVFVNLWGMVIARPGGMKSPSLSEAIKPLQGFEVEGAKKHAEAVRTFEIDNKLAKILSKKSEKATERAAQKDPAAARAMLEQEQNIPDEPTRRRFIVNDTTVEKLGELLGKHPWGLLVFRDELYGLLTSMDKQGQEGSRAFYLTGYDGNQGYTFDRIMRGTTHIERVCIAMLGGIQPGKIENYVRNAVAGGSGDDGLLQRFALTVWPDGDSEFNNVDQWPNKEAKAAAYAVFERLAHLQPASESDPQEWRFDEDAQEEFNKWRIPFEQELNRGELHPALESHLAKYRKLVPALALIFALIDTPGNDNRVGRKELLRALAFTDYLRTHAERLYSAATRPEVSGAVALLKKVRSGTMGTMFAVRDVVVKGWAGLGNTEVVRKAAEMLCDYGWLRKEHNQDTGGRPSETYVVNPATFLEVA